MGGGQGSGPSHPDDVGYLALFVERKISLALFKTGLLPRGGGNVK